MVRSSLVCLCLRCLPIRPVAFGHNINIASVTNTTFETASVSYYLEKSTAVLTSAVLTSVLCRHVSLWFCNVHHPNVSAPLMLADFASGISLTAHREEIDHHVLNPTAPSPWSFAYWVHDPNTDNVAIRSNTSSYSWMPEVTADMDILPSLCHNMFTRFVVTCISHYLLILLLFPEDIYRVHSCPSIIHIHAQLLTTSNTLTFASS